MPRGVQEAAREMRLHSPDAEARRLRWKKLCVRRLPASTRPCPRSGNGLRRLVDRQRGTRREHRRNVDPPAQQGPLGAADGCGERPSAVHDHVHGNMVGERPPCPGESFRPPPAGHRSPRSRQYREPDPKRRAAELAACDSKLSGSLRERPHVVRGARHARSGHHGAASSVFRKGARYPRNQAAAGASACGPTKGSSDRRG